MSELPQREQAIIANIHRNYHDRLLTNLVARLDPGMTKKIKPENLEAWFNTLADVRTLNDSYLNSLDFNTKNSGFIGRIFGANGKSGALTKALQKVLPNKLGTLLGAATAIPVNAFSSSLHIIITGLLHKNFMDQFGGENTQAEKLFNEALADQSEFSMTIKQECEEAAQAVMILFHFREMLLLGNTTRKSAQMNARKDFLERAGLKKEKKEVVNTAIEVYFLKELNKIFSNAFQKLYDLQKNKNATEENSEFNKWFGQTFNSKHERNRFTGEIQLKFMELTRDFLVEKMHEPGFISRNRKKIALLAGLIACSTVSISLIALFGIIPWALPVIIVTSVFLPIVALVALALTSAATFLLIKHWNFLSYKRSSMHRKELDLSIKAINNDILAVKEKSEQDKETSQGDIKQSRKFQMINQSSIFPTSKHGHNPTRIARGSVNGWLRDYAARYKDSKSVEIDLGDQYKKLILQSMKQTERLINSINKHTYSNSKHQSITLAQWINDTMDFIKDPKNAELINDFELIQQFKEQVLYIASSIRTIPPILVDWYQMPISKGGLGGNPYDAGLIRSVLPYYSLMHEPEDGYKNLLKVALDLFQKNESKLTDAPYLFGDGEFRNALGIAKEDNLEKLTPDNIDSFLNNSFTLLLTLCREIQPGYALDPLKQPVQAGPQYYLYRLLLTKQLVTILLDESQKYPIEIKLKIRKFIERPLGMNTNLILENFSNHSLLFIPNEENLTIIKNQQGMPSSPESLNNIAQFLILSCAYNNKPMTLQDALLYAIDNFLDQKELPPASVFGYNDDDPNLATKGTSDYLETLKKFIKNTNDFVGSQAKNNLFSMTNIMDCYKSNVSAQVYRTLLRITRLMKEKHLEEQTEQVKQDISCLNQAFQELSAFAKSFCYPLKEDSKPKLLLGAINSVITDNKTFPHVDANQMLLDMMEHIGGQIEFPKLTNPSAFFKKPRIEVPSPTTAAAPAPG